MAEKPEIILCEVHLPQDLSHFFVEIAKGTSSLPSEIEMRVHENWAKFSARNPQAKDNPVAYLQYYETRTQGVSIAQVRIAPFSYNQWFNRDDKTMQDTAWADLHGYNPLASWILPRTVDNYVLFGKKRNMGSKVSAFGGFTNDTDITGSSVDMNRHVVRTIRNEAGKLAETIGATAKTGVNFSVDVNPYGYPRGFDGVYVVQLDCTKEQAIRAMQETSQFDKELIPVEFSPANLVSFLHQAPATRSCVGGVFSVLGAYYPGDFAQSLASYQTDGTMQVTKMNPPLSGSVAVWREGVRASSGTSAKPLA
jgi:hypothetical protein